MHFIVPEGLPAQMAWMYDLPTWMHYAAGIAEILGGLALILPGLTKSKPELTPVAAAALAIVTASHPAAAQASAVGSTCIPKCSR